MAMLKFRTRESGFRFHKIFEIPRRDLNSFFSDPMRCPLCGCGAWGDDVIAGMRQYSLPLDFDDYDHWYLFAICHECNGAYVYTAKIDPDA